MPTNNLKIVILGPPTSGKGTRAKIIARELGIEHISTGDMFRAIVLEDSDLGHQVKTLIDAGNFIPDDLTNEIVKTRLAALQTGFILDGYPRTLSQANFLNTISDIHTAFYVKVSDQEAEYRVSGRRACESCGRIYHTEYNRPRVFGRCDDCYGRLIQRPDDNAEVMRTRLKNYYQLTHPIIEDYQKRDLLVEISGEQDLAAGLEELSRHLQALAKHHSTATLPATAPTV